MKIVVIGGGIVGMSTAWRLSQDGHDVTVLDRSKEPGQGTSFANAGQLSYSYVAPLADGTIWGQLPKLLTDPDSPVRFRPGFDLFQYRWLMSFLAACTSARAMKTIDRLGEIADLSRRVLHGAPVFAEREFSWTRTGKIVVYSSAKSFDHARAQAEHQSRGGTDRRALTAEESLAVEPALEPIAGRLVGGLFSPNDEAADAYRLSKVLADLLTQDGRSRFAGETEVTGFDRRAGRIAAVVTDRGDFDADFVVIAAGTEARRLGKMAGIDLPIYPIKGYSATAAIGSDEAAPRVSVTDAARKMVYARIGENLRIAGAADLVGLSRELDMRRVATLMNAAKADFPDAAVWDRARLWAGLRPATPTGLPVIGRMGPDNLFVNAGHGALGFTLALGSGEMLAAQIGGRETRSLPARPAGGQPRAEALMQ